MSLMPRYPIITDFLIFKGVENAPYSSKTNKKKTSKESVSIDSPAKHIPKKTFSFPTEYDPHTTSVRGLSVTNSNAVLAAKLMTSCCLGKVYSGLQ